MKIIETKVLRGPNFWSIKRQKLIQFTLDLEDLEEKPSDVIHGFCERLQQLLPSLHEHECSRRRKGGFFERLQEGTWMGHVIEHIALELQIMAGIPVSFGRTRGTGKNGVYHVVYEYDEEAEGLSAGRAAVAIVEAIIKSQLIDVCAQVNEVRNLWYRDKPGPTTGSIIKEAKRRDIPAIRLDDNSLVQLGYGARQKRIEASLTCNTSAIAVDLACDKAATKQLLSAAYIPTPAGEMITSIDRLVELIGQIGYPVVIKPLNGNHGRGVTINIQCWEDAEAAYYRAKNVCENLMVEKFTSGNDYRILVINNKFVAAAFRKPACIKGDGYHTIQELIDLVNKDPRRGVEHENVLTTIKVDECTLELLKQNDLTLTSILQEGKELLLKLTANLSTGGTATDTTEEVHPENISLFERTARLIGLDICGIDVIAETLDKPITQTGGAVIEVNAAPGLRMHLEPSYGKCRNVAAPIVDMLFGNDGGRIPVIAVTGTNGKTTTTRLIAQMAKQAGFNVGFTTTDGVYINSERILKGDCSGPQSAKLILKDSSIEFAVLETARGGILRSGLGFDKCQCAVITNIASDHLGLDGIDTLEKLARVKSVIAESVTDGGYAVLNADDDLVYAMKDQVTCNVALFTMHSENIRVEQHCEAGGVAAVYENGYVLIRKGNHYFPVEEVANIPVTFNGKADFNIANTLAACLAAYVSDIKMQHIRDCLRSFTMSSSTTPGRLNFYSFDDFEVMIDYAHNPHGMKALGRFIKSLDAQHRVGIVTGIGDRRDEDIIAVGEEAARIFHEIIIRHDEDLRGRTAEDIDRLLMEGIRKVDKDVPCIFSSHECEALEMCINNRLPNSIIVILVENIETITNFIYGLHKNYQSGKALFRQAV